MHAGRSALLQYHLALANRLVVLARPREKARRRLLNFFLTLARADITRRYGISLPGYVSNSTSFFRTRNADYRMHVEKRTHPEPAPSRHGGQISVPKLEVFRWQRDEVKVLRPLERLFHLEARNFPLSILRSVSRRGRREMKWNASDHCQSRNVKSPHSPLLERYRGSSNRWDRSPRASGSLLYRVSIVGLSSRCCQKWSAWYGPRDCNMNYPNVCSNALHILCRSIST